MKLNVSQIQPLASSHHASSHTEDPSVRAVRIIVEAYASRAAKYRANGHERLARMTESACDRFCESRMVDTFSSILAARQVSK